MLGSTSNVEVVNDRLWVVTGNNLSFGADLVRRTTWVTIDPGVPNPELRTGFAIPDLHGWVRDHRAELLHALLTMVAAWQAAGRPMPPQRSSDSYAAWRATVGGILTHAGVPGEFDAVESAQQTVGADDEGWGEFLSAAVDVFPGGRLFTAKDVVSALTRPDGWGLTASPLAESLPTELAEKHERGQNIARSLGKWLKHRNGRWSDGLVCEEQGRNVDNVTQYRIRRQ